MAVSDYDMYHLQDHWRGYMLEDEWIYNGILGTGVPIKPTPIYIQQNRDMVSRALTIAADMMTPNLGYAIRPIWKEDLIPFGIGWPRRNQTLQLTSGYVQTIGKRATELIQADVAIVYSDVGGLGVNDTATITVNTTHPVSEVGIYYRVADGAYSAGDVNWQITGQSVRASKSGNTVTIVAHRALFVSPNQFIKRPYESPNYNEPNAADTNDATDFVTLVDVYREYADTTGAVQLISDPSYWCDGNCTDNVTNGCARVVNAQLGLIQVRGDACACYGDHPQYARVYYKAGYPLDAYGRPDIHLAQAVFRLANTIMPERVCPICDQTYDMWHKDREDETVALEYVGNPFGLQKGAVSAWRTVGHRMIGMGGKFP